MAEADDDLDKTPDGMGTQNGVECVFFVSYSCWTIQTRIFGVDAVSDMDYWDAGSVDYDDLFSNDAESPELQLFLLDLEVVVSWQGLVGQTLLEELMPRIRIHNI